MNKSKIKLTVALILLTVFIVHSVAVHQRMHRLIQRNIEETGDLILNYGAYLIRLRLSELNEDVKSANLGYAHTLYARIKRHIYNSTPLQIEDRHDFNNYIADLHTMLTEAVNENSAEKYAIVENQLLNMATELDNLNKTIQEKSIIKIPFIGEYAMRNELANTIKLIIDSNK